MTVRIVIHGRPRTWFGQDLKLHVYAIIRGIVPLPDDGAQHD